MEHRFLRLPFSLLLVLVVLGPGCRSTYYSTMERFGVYKRDLLKKRVVAARDDEQQAGLRFKDAVTFIAAFALMAAARKLDRHHVHGLCLTLGGLGLLAVGFIHGEQQKYLLLIALALGGVAWASILSMPYAILAGALPPQRMGVYMGTFNFFIVLPEIVAALTFGPLAKNVLGGNLVHAVMAGGVFMLIAALLTQWVEATPVSGLASR